MNDSDDTVAKIKSLKNHPSNNVPEENHKVELLSKEWFVDGIRLRIRHLSTKRIDIWVDGEQVAYATDPDEAERRGIELAEELAHLLRLEATAKAGVESWLAIRRQELAAVVTQARGAPHV